MFKIDKLALQRVLIIVSTLFALYLVGVFHRYRDEYLAGKEAIREVASLKSMLEEEREVWVAREAKRDMAVARALQALQNPCERGLREYFPSLPAPGQTNGSTPERLGELDFLPDPVVGALVQAYNNSSSGGCE